jgi:tRNA pseudouridine38-40 synthase
LSRTFKFTIAYDGTAYAGFQWQPKFPTIQGELERAIHTVTHQTVRVTASGRTDAGVHAIAQVASVELTGDFTPEVFQRAVNAELPPDISILSAEFAPERFHPIRDAVRKRYRYLIHDGRLPDVFRRRYAWHIRDRLDEKLMHEAAQAWVGKHDFAAFENSGSVRLETVRTVFEATIERPADDPNIIRYEIEADGFLYNMVRTMVGTLVTIGRAKQPTGWAAEVLASRDRSVAGVKAPAHGLFLVKVDY